MHALPARRPPSRAEVVRLARLWIGTPYHHQASRRGAGVDCIGLVRGVWRELYGHEPERPPAYSRDWAEATGQETLIEAARRHLVEIDIENARPGDALVFRYSPRVVAKHTGILATPVTHVETGASLRDATSAFTLLHAVEGVPVAESPLGVWWRRRMVAAFAFPGVLD